MLNAYLTDTRSCVRVSFKNQCSIRNKRKKHIFNYDSIVSTSIKYDSVIRHLPKPIFKDERKSFSRRKKESMFDIDGVLKSSEKCQYIALRRARVTVVDYALCNDFDYFGTITIDSSKLNQLDICGCLNRVLDLFKYIRDKYSAAFKYILVPEFGSKRNRLHFHFLFMGFPTELLSVNKYYKLDIPMISSKIGFVQVTKINNTLDDRSRVAKYCSKYITKNNLKIFNHRYFCSKGLKKPIKHRLNYYDTIPFLRELELWDIQPYCNTYNCTSFNVPTYIFELISKTVFNVSKKLLFKGIRLYNTIGHLINPFNGSGFNARADKWSMVLGYT